MEFLGIGYQEVLVILVLLLVVVGPERLPRMAFQLGKAVRTLQEYARAVRDEFREEFDYIEEQYRTVRGEVDDAAEQFRSEQSRFNTQLRELHGELRTATEPLQLAAGAESSAPSNVIDITAHTPAASTTFPAEPAAVLEEPSAPVEKAAPPAPPLVF